LAERDYRDREGLTGSTRLRWDYAIKDKAFDLIR
jgi:hypothetical protein